MAISLVKGGSVELSSGLKSVLVCLGWKSQENSGVDFDLDASCFMLTQNGKVRSNDDFIFYNQLKSTCGSVCHSGDDLKGSNGCIDDEVIKVQLDKVPADIVRLDFTVTIHKAQSRGQNFGMVNSAFIRIVDKITNEEIVKFDLAGDASTNTAIIFGELYKTGSIWKFKAVGQGFDCGLLETAQSFGVNI